MSLPAADDLFRPTVVPEPGAVAEPAAEAPAETEAEPEKPRTRAASGRVRHDEKMTVYVTSEELLDLEHARLLLRRHQGLAVDRGRLVRTAVALVLADYEARGEESALVERLTQE